MSQFSMDEYVTTIRRMKDDVFTSTTLIDTQAIARDIAQVIDDDIFDKVAEIKGYKKCSECTKKEGDGV